MSHQLAIRHFSIALDPPLRSSAGEIASREGIALRLRTPEIVGVGEATPLPGWTEPGAQCRDALESLAGSHDAVTPEMGPDANSAPATAHGIDLAILDVQARSADQSLAEFLAEDGSSTMVPVQMTIGIGDREDCVERASTALDAGYNTIKCKIGGTTVHRARDRIRAIRDVVGENVGIRLDANRAWDGETANEAFAAFADMGIEYIEEPLANPTPAGLSRLDRNGIGLALDETVAESAGSLDRSWYAVADALILKPIAIGGVSRAYQTGLRALEHDVTPVVSTTIDAVIARTAAVHLAAALPMTSPAGIVGRDRLVDDLAADPVEFCKGQLSVPDGPGIGTLGPWDRTAREGVIR